MVNNTELEDDPVITNQEKLKYALWACLGKLVDETSLNCGSNATPQFIGALMHLVWGQIEGSAKELEAFARSVYGIIVVAYEQCGDRHAGRSQVNVSDVLMLARRHPELLEVLTHFSRTTHG